MGGKGAEAEAAGRGRVALRRLLLVLAASVGAAVLVEVGYRALRAPDAELADRVERLRARLDGGRRHFAPHPHLGFVRSDPSPAPLPLGWTFRREKTEGVPRIACLGASTTQEGYPNELQLELLADGRLAECMNWGVSGWTSAEVMINWFVNVQDYDPDVVVIHVGGNDVAPRKVAGFRSDYGHYRGPWKEPELSPLSRLLCRVSDLYARWIVEREGFTVTDFVAAGKVPIEDARADPGGDLTPDTAAPFRRNVATICEHALATGRVVVLMTMPWQPDPEDPHNVRATELLFVQGVREHNAILRDLAAEHDVLLVDAAAACAADPERWSPTFEDIVHQDVEGRRLKAKLVAEALRAVDLPPAPPELQRAVRDAR